MDSSPDLQPTLSCCFLQVVWAPVQNCLVGAGGGGGGRTNCNNQFLWPGQLITTYIIILTICICLSLASFRPSNSFNETSNCFCSPSTLNNINKRILPIMMINWDYWKKKKVKFLITRWSCTEDLITNCFFPLNLHIISFPFLFLLT